jgi:hypothetical protein
MALLPARMMQLNQRNTGKPTDIPGMTLTDTETSTTIAQNHLTKGIKMAAPEPNGPHDFAMMRHYNA